MAEEEKKEAEKPEEPAAAAAGAGGSGDSGETSKASDSSNSSESSQASESSNTSEAGKAGEAAAAEPAKPAEPDWKDLYARLKADFDNYKKRAARDREDVYRYAESDILKDILPTVDNLQLALANAKPKTPPQPEGEPAAGGDAASGKPAEDPFVKGVQLVCDTLLKALKEHGAEPFDSVGKALDTETMEAITMMPSAEIDEGKVVAEARKGWLLRGRTLRAAQVVVSSGKPA